MVILDRDKKIIREIDRWRVCQGRHIKELTGFSGQRACDRRLSKLIEAGYIKREKILYGVAGIYRNTSKATRIVEEQLYGVNRKIKIEQIMHDIVILDTAIAFNKMYGIGFDTMKTDIELHRLDGFGLRKHRPDFVYNQDGKTICVEIELSLKSKVRFENIIKDNFLEYDKQIWVVPKLENKITKVLNDNMTAYPNIEILELAEIKKVIESDNNVDTEQ